jgi:hypothetical protein
MSGFMPNSFAASMISASEAARISCSMVADANTDVGPAQTAIQHAERTTLPFMCAMRACLMTTSVSCRHSQRLGYRAIE